MSTLSRAISFSSTCHKERRTFEAHRLTQVNELLDCLLELQPQRESSLRHTWSGFGVSHYDGANDFA
ncbi:hypothetical protein FOMPIDRAFT_1023449 [Fomitopsis schrenkii]|uniref:Uncharacterized protein n=1 Tax=Fomitopsis schrenkii TaxID=2126942 RepID=S8E7X6_FOMSC|nr:hypothetical protein FOMPIDRAFT_1023449 [Fomitopsis schrenkii]